MNIYHILVTHEYKAKDILLNLKSTDQFAEFAKKHSICSSAISGGDLGLFRSGRFAQAFEEACGELKINIISKPVRTQFGWHIILKMIK